MKYIVILLVNNHFVKPFFARNEIFFLGFILLRLLLKIPLKGENHRKIGLDIEKIQKKKRACKDK